MNPNHMRFIDRHVGIPACFILSAVHKIRAAVHKRGPKPAPPKNVLFIELSEMGSAVLAYPAMAYVKERYPESRMFFLIFQQNRFSVDYLDIIPQDHVFTISTRSLTAFLKTTIQALGSMRKARIDTVFDLELFSRFSALLTGLSPAARRVGYRRYHEEGLYRGGFLTHPVAYNCYQHMSRNFLALVKAVEHDGERPLLKEKIPERLPVPIYTPPRRDVSAMTERLDRIHPGVSSTKCFVALMPSAGELLPVRAWPLENYIRLTRRILDRFPVGVVISGLDDARPHARRILNAVGPDRCFDLTGQTEIPELFALMAMAKVLITSDGGPAHFASLTDTPAVVLFGPETPRLYAPLGPRTVCLFEGLACSPCLSAYNHRKTRCRDARCMKMISVDAVFSHVAALLETPAGSRKPVREIREMARFSQDGYRQ